MKRRAIYLLIAIVTTIGFLYLDSYLMYNYKAKDGFWVFPSVLLSLIGTIIPLISWCNKYLND